MYNFFLDGVVGKLCAREQSSGNVNFLVFIYTLVYYHSMCGINIGVSVRFRSKERETRVKHRAKSFLPLVSFLARSKPNVPFLGLSLLRNQTRKRLLRRLCVTGLAKSLYGVFPCLLGQCIRQGSRLKGREKFIRHASDRDNRESSCLRPDC